MDFKTLAAAEAAMLLPVNVQKFDCRFAAEAADYVARNEDIRAEDIRDEVPVRDRCALWMSNAQLEWMVAASVLYDIDIARCDAELDHLLAMNAATGDNTLARWLYARGQSVLAALGWDVEY
jgi:hypothetical protein